MKRVSVIGLAVVCVLALSAVMATTAEAKEGPFWRLCVKGGTGAGSLFEDSECSKLNAAGPFRGERLASGVAKGVMATVKKTFKLTSGTITIECTGMNLLETGTKTGTVSWSRINGSNAGTSGGGTQVIEFTGCTVAGNGEKCEVEGKKITTKELTVWLDKEKEKAVKGEKLLVSFKPTSGLVFVLIKFKPAAGGKCTLTEASVETGTGKLGVAAIAETETAPKSGKLEPVKLEENEKLTFKNALTFPPTLLKEEWIEEGGVVKKVEEKLSFAGKAVAVFEGSSIVELKEEGGIAKESFGVFGK
jgi:hypothetical protein